MHSLADPVAFLEPAPSWVAPGEDNPPGLNDSNVEEKDKCAFVFRSSSRKLTLSQCLPASRPSLIAERQQVRVPGLTNWDMDNTGIFSPTSQSCESSPDSTQPGPHRPSALFQPKAELPPFPVRGNRSL